LNFPPINVTEDVSLICYPRIDSNNLDAKARSRKGTHQQINALLCDFAALRPGLFFIYLVAGADGFHRLTRKLVDAKAQLRKEKQTGTPWRAGYELFRSRC
jgi:hypothetical protein